MKKFLMPLLLILVFAFTTFAQTTVKAKVDAFGGNSLGVYTTGTINATAYIQSDYFTLDKFNADTIKCFYGKSLVSATGLPHATTIVQGSFDMTNFTTVATIGATGDSTETYQTGIVPFGSTYFPYYRVKTTGVGANPSDAVLKLYLYFTKLH